MVLISTGVYHRSVYNIGLRRTKNLTSVNEQHLVQMSRLINRFERHKSVTFYIPTIRWYFVIVPPKEQLKLMFIAIAPVNVRCAKDALHQVRRCLLFFSFKGLCSVNPDQRFRQLLFVYATKCQEPSLKLHLNIENAKP